jgi:chromosome segregation ATPase
VCTAKLSINAQQEIEKLKAQLMVGASSPTSAANASENSSRNAAADGELAARLASLQSAQQQTWEEKEALSRALELERQNNVTAAIGQVVDEVKQSKLETMKSIKRLQKGKEALTKKQKALRAQYDGLKDALQLSMTQYETTQAEYDQVIDKVYTISSISRRMLT